MQLKGQAQQARKQALDDLAAVCDQIAPPGPDGGATQLAGADDVTLADALRSLWATPVAHREVINAQLEHLRDQRSWLNHVKSTPSEFDEAERFLAKGQKRALLPELRKLESKLAGVEGGIEGKLPLTKLASYTVGDGIGADPVGRIGKVMAEIPVLGVGAAGLATYLQAKDDHEKGWSWGHALVADGAPNAVGLVAGTGAGMGMAAVAVAVGAPEGVAVVGAAAVGILVGYGVGAFGNELVHAHWSDNIHRDGVVGASATASGRRPRPPGTMTWTAWLTRSGTRRRACGNRFSAEMTHNRWRSPVPATGLFGRRRAPKPLDTNQVACGIKFVGTTWLTRGRAYWIRRVALWLAVLLVTAMAVGVAIGGLKETHDALLRGVIIGVFSVGNAAAFVVVLALSWPTDARCRKSWTSAGLGRPRGRGAAFAMCCWPRWPRWRSRWTRWWWRWQ